MKAPARESLKRLAGPAAVLLAGTGIAAAARALRRRPPIQFRDRVAVITGGSRGLGLLMARELAAQGARLAILARDPAELDLARRELTALGGQRVLALPCDVSDRDEVRVGRRRRGRALRPAGHPDQQRRRHPGGSAGAHDAGGLRRVHADPLLGSALRHDGGPPPPAPAGDGRIVNISSIGGRIAIPHLVPYSASKFALVGLSDGLRTELAKEGIYVTTVCPGLMRTGSHVNAQFKGKRRRGVHLVRRHRLAAFGLDGRPAGRPENRGGLPLWRAAA